MRRILDRYILREVVAGWAVVTGVLLVILLAAIFGLVVGALPGLTATMATALLVPITFFMAPAPAIAAIVTAEQLAIQPR